MKKTLFALLLSALGIGTCFGAGVQGKNDILDPIYETSPLPENYYIKEESKNKIIYANDRVPNMFMSVEFLQSDGKPLYEILADKMYVYRRAHPDDILQSCQNDMTLKNFSSYAFTCIRNQDSTVMVVATQFEDMNNLPSDFYRIMTMAAKSGDSPASDEMGEMINYANYKLGFFENFNIPQKTTLSHYIDDNLRDIDLEGLVKISGEGENLWKGSGINSPIDVENVDITNQGMKFFLKLPSTNEKFLATIHLSEEDSTDKIAEQIRDVLASAYHKCKKPKETSDVDTHTLLTSCSEGDIKVVIRKLPVTKYEFKTYLIITGESSALDQLFTDQSLYNRLNSYLNKQFYDTEMLHKSNNVFGYMQEIEAGSQIKASMNYVVDKSTAKSLVAVKSIPNDDKNTKKPEKETSSVVQNNSKYEEDDFKFEILAGALAIAGLLIFLFIAVKKQKAKKAEEEEARREQEELEKHQQENANTSLSGESDELLAEIEAERMARKRAAYKNQREAENLARELEEKQKNLSEEERKRRKAALANIASQNAPDAIASALSAPKEKVAESNLKANEMIKAQREEEYSSTEPAPVKEPETKKASSPNNVEPSVQSSPAEEIQPVQEETVQIQEPQVNPADLMKSEEELAAERERKRKEEERKARSNELLMKMKQAQKSDISEARKEEKEEEKKPQEPVSKKPSVTFRLAGDKPKAQQPEIKKEEPVVQPKSQNFFANEEMVQLSEPAVQPQATQNFFASEEMIHPSEPAVQPQAAQNFFASEEMVQPSEPAVQSQTAQNFFASEEMVQPSEPAVQSQTAQNFFASEEMVRPSGPAVQPQAKQNFFNSEEMVQSSEPQPKMQDFFESEVSAQHVQTGAAPASKPKVRDPLEELARKSKKIQPVDDEPEIDLEAALGEDINLDMFANDFSAPSPSEPVNAMSDDETVLDLSSSEDILDLTSMAQEPAQNQSYASNQYADSLNLEVETPARKTVEEKPKKKTTKKIRKFNLGSLSVSLPDKQ